MLKCLPETFEPEEEVAGIEMNSLEVVKGTYEIAGDAQKNVVVGQEVWEVATFMVATCGATSIVTARATCFIEDAGNSQQIEDILDKEIELSIPIILYKKN